MAHPPWVHSTRPARGAPGRRRGDRETPGHSVPDPRPGRAARTAPGPRPAR